MNHTLIRTGLIFFFLLFFFPPLVAIHAPPIASFWNEWVAGVLAVLIWGICWMARDDIVELPLAIVIWILWGATFLLSALFNTYYFSAAIFHYLIFWFSGALVILGAATLKRSFGLEFVYLTISYALAFSGIFQAILGFARHSGLLIAYSPYLAPMPMDRLAGLLNYPTIQGFSLWLSLLSLLYLFLKKRISMSLLALVCFFISIAIIATGDRASIVYYISVVAVLLVLWSRSRRKGFTENPELKHALKGCIFIFLIFIFSFYAYKPLYHYLRSDAVVDHSHEKVTLNNGFERKQFLGIRVLEFKKAIIIFDHNPIFGIGPGNYPYQSFLLDDKIINNSREGTVNTHSHNIFSMLMAEEGAVGLFVLILALVCMLFWWWRMGVSAEAFFSGSIFSVYFIFSNLEFPLWYFNFLSMFLVFFAIVSPSRSFRLDHPILKQGIAVVATAISLIIAVNVASGFTQISKIEVNHISTERSLNTLSSLLGDHFWGPYAGKVIEQATNPEMKNARGQLRLADRLAHFLPMPMVLVTKAILLDFIGKEEAACSLAEKTANSYPVALIQYQDTMKDYKKRPSILKGKHPENLKPCFVKGATNWKAQWRN